MTTTPTRKTKADKQAEAWARAAAVLAKFDDVTEGLSLAEFIAVTEHVAQHVNVRLAAAKS